MCKLGYATELHAPRGKTSWMGILGEERLHNWFYARPSAFHIGGKGPGKCQRWKSGQHSTPAELQSDHQLQPAWEMAGAQGCFKMEMLSSPGIFLHLEMTTARFGRKCVHSSQAASPQSSSCGTGLSWLWGCSLASPVQPFSSLGFGVWITPSLGYGLPQFPWLEVLLWHSWDTHVFWEPLPALWLCLSVLTMPCYYSCRIQPFRGGLVLIILFI